MSIQLSKDEKIIKKYDYETVTQGLIQRNTTEKELIVTNKRIIHCKKSHTLGGESTSNYEIPVNRAQFIDVSYGKRSHTIFLVLGILCALYFLIGLFAGIAADSISAMTIISLLLGVGFILLYVFIKQYFVSCLIYGDTRLTPLFATSGQTVGMTNMIFGPIFGSGKSIFIRVDVKHDVAQAMVEELGAIIKDINEGNYTDEI